MTNFFYSLLVASDGRFEIIDRTIAWLKIAIFSFITSGFIISLQNEFNVWFSDNQKFVNGFIIVMIANIILGGIRHLKTKTFSWHQFLVKNSIMMFVVSIVYLLLHRLHLSSGDNMLSNGFESFIQVLTLFYPISKAIKSLYIISNGDYPPKFIMEKIYNFEKDGDLKELFSQPNKKEDES